MRRKVFVRRAAMAFVVAAAVLATAPLLEAQPNREFTLEREVDTPPGWVNIPRWNAGRLVGYLNNRTDGPVLYTIDRVGQRDEFLFAIPDAFRIDIKNVAIGPSGEIAVVAGAYTADGRTTTLVARIPPDRKDWRIIRTWPYVPMNVTIASDGCIWTIGYLKDSENIRVIAEPLLKRYDANGTVVGSQIVVDAPRGSSTMNNSFLFSSRDRVGWFTTGGKYIEFSLDGKEIGRYEGPRGLQRRDISGVAISEDNDVVVGNFERGKAEFLALDRSSRSWIPVSLPKEDAPTGAYVLGFDGTTLVTTTQNGKLVRFKTR